MRAGPNAARKRTWPRVAVATLDRPVQVLPWWNLGHTEAPYCGGGAGGACVSWSVTGTITAATGAAAAAVKVMLRTTFTAVAATSETVSSALAPPSSAPLFADNASSLPSIAALHDSGSSPVLLTVS